MNWRDRILQEFTPQVASLTLVADPDNLLTEIDLLQSIQEKGFVIEQFEDAIAFRYIYESKYRDRWQENKNLDLVVLLKIEASKLNALPYDLIQSSRQLAFSLSNLFPHLSYSVINALDRSNFDNLYCAQTQYSPIELGENRTKDFVLRYVFDIAPEMIKEASDLLLILLRCHYRGQQIPDILNERLLQLLRERSQFRTWPLETIIPDRQAFFAFLQTQWPNFVRRQVDNSKQVSELKAKYITSTSTNLPFDHEDIRIYIDNLFLEGYLQPISVDELGLPTANINLNSWIIAGLQIDPATDKLRRLDKLLQSLEAAIPSNDAKHQQWLKFAHSWAELLVLSHQIKTDEPLRELPKDQLTQFSELQEKIDNTFLNWVIKRYGGLYNQPAIPPVILHQIPRFLARYCTEYRMNKVALLVLDGLSLEQWLILRKVLLTQRPQLKYSEDTVFAWIPTITSISRQALFAGKPPLYFPTSLETTAKEATLWTQFWTEEGLTPVEIGFHKGLGELDNISEIERILSHPRLRVVGLVVDKVDKIMHGMQLGSAGMYNQVRQWGELGFMANLLDLLLNNGFKVFLTSDHGNIEAEGIGQPKEGAIAELRGERARVYPNRVLRSKVKSEFNSAIEWLPIGLPEEYLPLLAPGRKAFIREGEKTVAHGGISLEELIVPFISIEV